MTLNTITLQNTHNCKNHCSRPTTWSTKPPPGQKHLTLGPVYTLDHEVGPWKMAFPMVQLPWSDLWRNQIMKPLGPSLGVNRMWIKRNDLAPLSECADFFGICPKRAILDKSSLTILLSSLVFTFSSKKKSLNFYFNNISLPWARAFFSTSATILPLPPQNMLDHVNE